MRPSQCDAPHFLCVAAAPLPLRGVGGGKAEAPLLMKDSKQRLPSPTARGSGTEGSPTVAGGLGHYPALPSPLHTPEGKGGDSSSCLPHFSFPCRPEQGARHPHRLPRQNPATDTGTGSRAGAAGPRVFQARSPENTERGREAGDAERSRRGEGVPCAAFLARRET